MRKKNTVIQCLALAAMAAVGHAASAAIVYTSKGFENPPFTTGTVVGQDTWTQSGGGLTSAVVTTGIGTSSSQGLNVTRAASNDARFFPTPVNITPTGSTNFVNVDWDMNVPQATGAQTFGPFFGIETYDASNNRLAGVGVDSKTGEILFENPAAGNAFDVTPAHDVVSFGAYHHYQLRMNYSTHTADLWVDNSPKLSGFAFQTNSSTFGDADVSALAAQVEPPNQASSAVFDNYVVSNVPEPTMLAVFAGGSLLLLRRRVK